MNTFIFNLIILTSLTYLKEINSKLKAFHHRKIKVLYGNYDSIENIY